MMGCLPESFAMEVVETVGLTSLFSALTFLSGGTLSVRFFKLWGRENPYCQCSARQKSER
jgi:hypothetical protein